MSTRSALIPALLLALAACGGPTATATSVTTSTTTAPTVTSAEPDAAGFPVTLESGGITTTVEAPPDAIVSLSPTATEMLFAVGAGEQVVAVDEFSYYPPEAPVTDLSGFTPNLEAIAAYQPDLVIVGNDQDGIVAALGDVSIPVLVLPAAVVVADAYDQVRLVGSATGHVEEADDVATGMERDIEELVASVSPVDAPLTYYHELGGDGGGSYYSVTSQTFIGEVFGAFGLVNIADEADVDGSGYPLLSVEFILEADPDVIFHTTCCGDSADTIAARPGWDRIAAVRSDAVFALDDDLASRWGPRLVDFFRIVAAALGEAG